MRFFRKKEKEEAKERSRSSSDPDIVTVYNNPLRQQSVPIYRSLANISATVEKKGKEEDKGKEEVGNYLSESSQLALSGKNSLSPQYLADSPLALRTPLLQNKKTGAEVSPLTIAKSVKEPSEEELCEKELSKGEAVFKEQVFIFECLFGDPNVREQRFDNFFNLIALSDPKIEEIDVQIFFKFMLKHLTPSRANMVLGQNG